MRLVLLGAPGSGKGTQGDILAEHFGVPHISSGELLRASSASQLLKSGALVPGDIVLDLVIEAVRRESPTGEYVLDGFPRTLEQAEQAHDLARSRGMSADAAILLALPDDIARSRLARRAAAGRSDDTNVSAIEQRLAEFHRHTEPLLAFYSRRGILVSVDATQPVPEVTRAILAGIDAITSD